MSEKDADPLAGLASELQAERARSFGLAAERMRKALAALAEHDARGGRELERQELLAEARERVWFFVVQRESIGLTDTSAALDFYRVSAEIRARLGPRRRGGS